MPPRRRPKSKAKVSEHSSDSAGDGIPQASSSVSTDQRGSSNLSQGFPLTSGDQASTGADQGETRSEAQTDRTDATPPWHRQHPGSWAHSSTGEVVPQRSGTSPVELPADPWQAHRQELSPPAPTDPSNGTAMQAPVSRSQIPGSQSPRLRHFPDTNLSISTRQPQQQRPSFNDNAVFVVEVYYFNMGQSEQQSEHLGMHQGLSRAQTAVRRFLAHPTMFNRRVLVTMGSRNPALGHGYEVMINGPLQGAHYDILVRMRHVGDAVRRAS